jgi:hypothetical protein
MKKIIIFRFDKKPVICLNRLHILKHYNPDVPVYGIYGGDENEWPEFKYVLHGYCEDIHVLKNRSSEWKWRYFDLVLCEWYRQVGHAVDFDMAYTSEWDMPAFGSLDEIYPGIQSGDVGLTGTIPLEKLENNWYWMSGINRQECFRLIYFAIKHYGYRSTPLGILCPGLCFPKSFLAGCCKLALPQLCNDEIRIPLLAQIMNCPVKDTGFFKGWFNPDEQMYFNCDKRLVSLQAISEALTLNRRKVFHPFRDLYPLHSEIK